MISIDVIMVIGIMDAYMFFLCIKFSKQFFPFGNSLKFNRFHVDVYMMRDLQNMTIERELFLGFGFLC